MKKIPGWKDQYDRVLRWHKRISDINQGILHNQDSRYYDDEIYSFFINCYHLRDWMLKDKTLTITKKDAKLKEFIDNSNQMKICHDICIGLKHLEITSPKIDKKTQFGSRHYNLTLGGNKPVLSVKYCIRCKGQTFDAFSLATECIKEWNNFIINNIDGAIQKIKISPIF